VHPPAPPSPRTALFRDRRSSRDNAATLHGRVRSGGRPCRATSSRTETATCAGSTSSQPVTSGGSSRRAASHRLTRVGLRSTARNVEPRTGPGPRRVGSRRTRPRCTVARNSRSGLAQLRRDSRWARPVFPRRGPPEAPAGGAGALPANLAGGEETFSISCNPTKGIYGFPMRCTPPPPPRPAPHRFVYNSAGQPIGKRWTQGQK